MVYLKGPSPKYNVIGVRPEFNKSEEEGRSAFEVITDSSFEGQWKVIVFYPKDFTFVCPTELVGFAQIVEDFKERDAVVLCGSPDNEYVKLAWRREDSSLYRLPLWQFADLGSNMARAFGVFDEEEKATFRATFIIDPENAVRHISVNDLNIGRNPHEILRILDALQTSQLCECNRPVGGATF